MSKDPRGRRISQWRDVQLRKGLLQEEMKLSEVDNFNHIAPFKVTTTPKHIFYVPPLIYRSLSLELGQSTTAGALGITIDQGTKRILVEFLLQ